MATIMRDMRFVKYNDFDKAQALNNKTGYFRFASAVSCMDENLESSYVDNLYFANAQVLEYRL